MRGWPERRRVTINDLARQLPVKHNSAVGLVDPLVQQGLMARESSNTDRRKADLALTPRGRDLATLAGVHRRELQRLGPIVGRFFVEIAG